MGCVYVFLANGFEEIEALAIIDILRRAGIAVKSVSIKGNDLVTGRSGITVKADMLFEQHAFSDAKAFVLPGGAVVEHYLNHPNLASVISTHMNDCKLIAAICAAPTFLAQIGLLEGKTAVCYPALEHILIENGASIGTGSVVTDGVIITSKGPATSIYFALAIVEALRGEETTQKIADELLVSLLDLSRNLEFSGGENPLKPVFSPPPL